MILDHGANRSEKEREGVRYMAREEVQCLSSIMSSELLKVNCEHTDSTKEFVEDVVHIFFPIFEAQG